MANSPTNKVLIVYHQVREGIDCPDGIFAAYIAASFYNFEVELVGEVYREEKEWKDYQLPFNPSDKIVYFLDWAGYPEELFQTVSIMAKEVVVIDHHIGARDKIYDLSQTSYIKGMYVPNEIGCGATATWDYFYPAKERPWFLKYVRSRDTGMGGYWDGMLPDHRAVNTTLSAIRKGKTGVDAFPIIRDIFDLEKEAYFLAEGLPKVEEEDKLSFEEIEYWLNNPKYINPLDYLTKKEGHIYPKEDKYKNIPFLVIQNKEANRLYSWIGAYLAQANKDSPYVIVVTTHFDSLSLRKLSSSLVDLSEIAKSFGGGGHATASGIPLSEDVTENLKLL